MIQVYVSFIDSFSDKIFFILARIYQVSYKALDQDLHFTVNIRSSHKLKHFPINILIK